MASSVFFSQLATLFVFFFMFFSLTRTVGISLLLAVILLWLPSPQLKISSGKGGFVLF